MKNQDKKFVIISIIIALLIVGVITVSSYAYFTISNKEGEETVIKSGTMALKLTDGDRVSASNMLPGETIEKEFIVTNTGSVETMYNVYLSEVINTFVDRSDLVYQIISNDGGYNTTTDIEIPSDSSKVINQQPIGVGVTHHYKIIIKFLSKDENQDDNQGAEFSGKIQVNEYTSAVVAPTHCTYSKTSNNEWWIATYECNEGTGTIIQCAYKDGSVCNGGVYNLPPLAPCINNQWGELGVHEICNSNVVTSEFYGGQMAQTEACSCS